MKNVLKFADDSVIISLLNNEEQSHGPVVGEFPSWVINLPFMPTLILLMKRQTKD